MEKKAQSQIVTAVLLILVVIALAVIILNFSTNFVQDSLGGTGCFELLQREGVKFGSDTYTCFDPKTASLDDGEVSLQVKIGDVNETISGFVVELGGASTNSFEIKEGVTFSEVRMSDGNYDEALSLPPARNSARTYVIKNDPAPDVVRLYPILSDGEVCDASDVIENIPAC